MSFVGDMFGGGDSSDASEKAANIQAGAQKEALAYLKEREEVPQAYREAALTGIGGEYGLTMDQEGNVISDGSSVMERAKASPYYQELMASQGAGEERLARHASMTGLRGGNTQGMLYDYNTRLQNQATTGAYNQQMQGLQGLGGLQPNTNQIANLMQGIGTTQAQGVIGGAQGQQAGMGMGINTILGGLGVAAGAGWI